MPEKTGVYPCYENQFQINSGESGETTMESIADCETLIADLSSMGFYVDGEELAKAMLKESDKLDNRMNPVKIY